MNFRQLKGVTLSRTIKVPPRSQGFLPFSSRHCQLSKRPSFTFSLSHLYFLFAGRDRVDRGPSFSPSLIQLDLLLICLSNHSFLPAANPSVNSNFRTFTTTVDR